MVNTAELKDKCEKTVEQFKKELGKMRSGRASASLIEGLKVDYYGSPVPLQQLGSISVPEPRMLTVQVFDASAADGIEKAILQSDLGLNPSRDGNLIRITVPALTEERRKQVIKQLHKEAEDFRVTVRNHRREAIDLLKKQQKNKEISEDDLRKAQESVQKVTDQHVAEIDKLLEEKEKEMMEV